MGNDKENRDVKTLGHREEEWTGKNTLKQIGSTGKNKEKKIQTQNKPRKVPKKLPCLKPSR